MILSGLLRYVSDKTDSERKGNLLKDCWIDRDISGGIGASSPSIGCLQLHRNEDEDEMD